MKQSYDIEQSISSSPATTYRDLDPTSAQNEHLDDFDIIKGAQEVTEKLKELQIRFDTNPKYLQKSDFDLLISILGKTIPWLYTQAQYTEIQDIETIRSGATAGSTAVQPGDDLQTSVLTIGTTSITEEQLTALLTLLNVTPNE